MAIPKLVLVCILLLVFQQANSQSLNANFYRRTCPSLESIVNATTATFISRVPSLAPALLRMHFHDCFVRGCDGSVLINSTSNNTAEKDSIPNRSLRGFRVIDAVKSAVERQCPGRVSCADILALVARDAVSLINGPFWPVPLGRRDGRVSNSTEALFQLPPPFFNSTQLIASFAAKNLTVKDLVVLSGSHTIGVAHCSSITSRLYNFTGRGDSDPTMDPNYVAALKRKCSPTDANSIIQMDPGSSQVFDENYYSIGCDGSILLNATGNGQAEKNAIPNLSLRGFGSIDRVKSVVEKKCPGVVSCTDILALAARDAVSFVRGHTIGTSHCTSFSNRLYNFTGRGDSDPSLDSEYVPRLMSKCRPGDQTTLAEMDPGSFKTFDEDYYTLVAKRRGLFTSDSALLDDNATRAYVRRHAISSERSKFFEDFAVSMVKMGNIEVLTGN
ncbi:hypothetical protein RD792_000091 [Penstemon davidsonii]|uniref:peroxidase n=1 Tax=Penstemon davidsonii TaxID=160366 RepID=A0ABR0DUX5_9LAMI|nr:hypothetical protein RD792_000091 [Penstemon davidsonii]